MWGLSIPFWESVFRWATISAFVFGGFTATAAFISAWVGYELSDIVQKDADKRILEAKVEATRATERTAVLSKQAEQLRKDTAEANAQALEAQLALEKFKAPRAISVEQRNRIVEDMKQFAGQQYFGMVASDVADAWDIWREISLSLELAGWKRLPPPGLAVAKYGPPAGIALAPQAGVMILSATGFPPSENMKLYDVAKALAAKLTGESIIAGAGFAGDIEPFAIAIVIGPKP